LFRHDQRAFLLHFTVCWSALLPLRPHLFRFAKSAFVTSEHPHCSGRSARFRLRYGDGRFALALFQPSHRQRYSFPFAELQAEAELIQKWIKKQEVSIAAIEFTTKIKEQP
jgi:hypothetical protein